jgi:hypothetical protein
MSWNSPTTFPPILTEVLGVTLTFQSPNCRLNLNGRKRVPNSQTIWRTLQQLTIELVKAEAKWHGKTSGVFAGQILAEVLQVNGDSSR